MDWLGAELSPELEFHVEVATRSMEPRMAMLYRTCIRQRESIQQAVWEIMRLELELQESELERQLLSEQLVELLDASAQPRMDLLRPPRRAPGA